MATDEDARSAARRIVEQALADREQALAEREQVGGRSASTDAVAGEAVEDAVDELTGDLSEAQAVEVVVDVAEDLASGADVSIDDADVTVDEGPVPDSRARARALVAEVLAAHEAARAGAAGDAEPVVTPVTEAARSEDVEVVAAPEDVEVVAAPEGSARSRARELVAEVLAAAEAREAAERAEVEARAEAERAAAESEALAEAEAEAERERRREAERRIEEARRAEEAREAAERERREALERERLAEAERRREEREREAVEARERALWADADDDVPSPTPPAVDDGGSEPDRTVPMSIAELAASGRSESDLDADADHGLAEGADDPERTALVTRDRTEVVQVDPSPPADVGQEPVAVTGTLAPPREHADGEVTERDERRHADVVDDTPTGDPRVLEATVDHETPPPPARGGRWLLVSVIGAITLAIVFPLAIRALLQLVALS